MFYKMRFTITLQDISSVPTHTIAYLKNTIIYGNLYHIFYEKEIYQLISRLYTDAYMESYVLDCANP